MAQNFTELNPQFENIIFEHDDNQMILNFTNTPVVMGNCA